MKIIKSIYLWTVYPFFIIGSLLLAHYLLINNWDMNWAVTVATVTFVLPMIVLEYFIPYLPSWKKGHKEYYKTGYLHLIFSNAAGIVAKFLIATLIMLTATYFRLDFTLWPDRLPLVIQLIAAVLIGDFGIYWIHRQSHKNAWLWKIHSIHHLPKKYFWLTTYYFHPLDRVLQTAVTVIPLTLLGCSDHVIGLAGVFGLVHGTIAHTNMNQKTGVLNWVLAVADIHRWHHSYSGKGRNANYGTNTVVWDVIFGTRTLPANPSLYEQIGLPQASNFPDIENYQEQMMYPFVNKKNEFKKKYGPWALITGASSGIGESFAKNLAQKKMNLVLVARRLDRLDLLAQELKEKFKIEVRTIGLDLSKDDFLPSLVEKCSDLDIGLLINNAGIGLVGDFESHPAEDGIKMLNLNVRTPFLLAQEFGNQMIKRKRGGIIFIGSTVSFQCTPYMAHYSATKAYCLNLAEGMSYEFKKKGVDVLGACPGETVTEFTKDVKMKQFAPMTSDKVADTTLKALGKKSFVVVGWMNKLMIFGTKISPKEWVSPITARMIQKLINQ